MEDMHLWRMTSNFMIVFRSGAPKSANFLIYFMCFFLLCYSPISMLGSPVRILILLIFILFQISQNVSSLYPCLDMCIELGTRWVHDIWNIVYCCVLIASPYDEPVVIHPWIPVCFFEYPLRLLWLFSH